MTDLLAFPSGLRADGLPAALSDPERLAAVTATGMMDTPQEEAFDQIAALAADITGCDRAFVTFVDESRSFWKAHEGVELSAVSDRQNPVRESFCSFVVGLEAQSTFAVADAAGDPRTRDHPSVAPMKIGAWAGSPITSSDGMVLGSVCAIDEVPHEWSQRELRGLAALARAVSTELRLRQSLQSTRRALAEVAELAASLQESLLPPVIVSPVDLDCSATYLAGHGAAVVGDFYDLFRSNGPWWCTFVGDVCGHGVDAAKTTALARYTLRAEAMQEREPSLVLERLNAALLAQRGDGRFVTTVFVRFHHAGERVVGQLCTAGHPPAMVRRASGDVEPLGVAGTLLGIQEDVTLYDVTFDLGPGDLLLLYTDGATEARSPRCGVEPVPRPEFGEEGLVQTLAACGGRTAEEVVGCLASAILEHTGGSSDDDVALLALRVPASARVAVPTRGDAGYGAGDADAPDHRGAVSEPVRGAI